MPSEERYHADEFSITSPHLDESHFLWRDQVRKFITEEITPYVDQWEEDCKFAPELYEKASNLGLLGMGYPEEYGGVEDGIDDFHKIIASEEFGRMSPGGVNASLTVHNIALPLVIKFCTDETKQEVACAVLSGKKHISLGITEPSAGSDVANLETTAVKDGDHYRVNGAKCYITGGMVADWLVTAVRTGEGKSGGVSLLLIDMHSDGVSRNRMQKMGWNASDTAQIYFDDVLVHADNLIGRENAGFSGIMHNFNSERLHMSASCIGMAKACIEEAVSYGRTRKTFGKRLMDHQVLRHKVSEMVRQVNATSSYLDNTVWQFSKGQSKVYDISLLKVQATHTLEFCAREACQILGGASYFKGNPVERIYRDVRVNAIGGGSEEIMRDLAARQLSL